MRHTWLAEKNVIRFFGDPAPIQKNYHVPDFRRDIANIPVINSVHIQCGVAEQDAHLETQWVQEQSDKYGLAGAIIAFCDLTQKNLEAQLDRHALARNFRGIRQIVGRDAIEDAKNGTNALLASQAFKLGLECLARHKLSFDLQLTPPLLTAAARLFKSVETLPVAICHAASPQNFTQDGLALWEAGLKDFAQNQNAICKISGFGMFDHNWTVESIREKILRVIDIFSPQRVAFGSNFPVDKLNASYVDVMSAYLIITEGFTKAERTAMFYDTAQSFYRM